MDGGDVVNRLCSSGLQAIVTGAQQIMLGDCDSRVGGGVEVMSKGAYLMTALRNGARIGRHQGARRHDRRPDRPFGVGHMGITAENLVPSTASPVSSRTHWRSSRTAAPPPPSPGPLQEPDRPDHVKQTKKGDVVFDTDEHVKPAPRWNRWAAQAGVQEGRRHGHRRQRLGHQRRRCVLRAGRRRRGRQGRPEAHRPHGQLRRGRRAERRDGRRPDPGLASLAEEGRSVGQPDGRGGKQRAFAAQAIAVSRGLELDPPRPTPTAAPSPWATRIGCSGAFIATKAVGEVAAHRRPLRAGDHVHRRRARHCGGVRAAAKPTGLASRPGRPSGPPFHGRDSAGRPSGVHFARSHAPAPASKRSSTGSPPESPLPRLHGATLLLLARTASCSTGPVAPVTAPATPRRHATAPRPRLAVFIAVDGLPMRQVTSFRDQFARRLCSLPRPRHLVRRRALRPRLTPSPPPAMLYHADRCLPAPHRHHRQRMA